LRSQVAKALRICWGYSSIIKCLRHGIAIFRTRWGATIQFAT
jgi:hypothetical protein